MSATCTTACPWYIYMYMYMYMYTAPLFSVHDSLMYTYLYTLYLYMYVHCIVWSIVLSVCLICLVSAGSGLLHQSSGSTLQAPTTTAPHTAPTKPTPPSSFLPPHLLPTSTTLTAHTTHTSTTAAAPAYSAMAADWRGRGEMGALGGVRPAAGLQTQAQDEESLFSMPPSLPDTSRCSHMYTVGLHVT